MANVDLTIKQGKTFSRVFRWGTDPILYKPITAISQGAPAQLTVPGHGLPDGWPAAIVSVRGMTEINARHNPPWPIDYERLSLLDANTITLNKVDSSNFTAYTSGGYVRTYTPVDLAGFIARMQIKDHKGGAVLASFTSAGGNITLDNTLKTITVRIEASATAGYAWTRGVFDLELENVGASYTKEIASGNVVVVREVTT
jgi:hypothetical protein